MRGLRDTGYVCRGLVINKQGITGKGTEYTLKEAKREIEEIMEGGRIQRLDNWLA